ncbi:hypothetical protein MICRO80W_10011 [Micrococcus luteus]|nr:hypothetical protein MICRO80W_10011 [Micrococcus luteus]
MKHRVPLAIPEGSHARKGRRGEAPVPHETALRSSWTVWAAIMNGSRTLDGKLVLSRYLSSGAWLEHGAVRPTGESRCMVRWHGTRRPVFPPSLRRAFHVKQNDRVSVLDASALVRQRRVESECRTHVTRPVDACIGVHPRVGRLPWHARSVDTSNGTFHVKRASGEGAVPRHHHFGLSKAHAISAAHAVTENDTTR